MMEGGEPQVSPFAEYLRAVGFAERHGQVNVEFLGAQRIDFGVPILGADRDLAVAIFQINFEIP